MINNRQDGSLPFPPQKGEVFEDIPFLGTMEMAGMLCDIPAIPARWRFYYKQSQLNQLVIEVEDDSEVTYLRLELRDITKILKGHGWESIQGGRLLPLEPLPKVEQPAVVNKAKKKTKKPRERKQRKSQDPNKLPGVTKSNSGRWVAQTRMNGRYTYLGIFNTQEQAYQAYLKAQDRKAQEKAQTPKD